jgi:hypothetical protein
MGVLPVQETRRGATSFEPLLELARRPLLLTLFAVDALRHVPGARLAARVLPWLAGGLLAGGAILLAAYMSERSPQRVSLADLASHNLPATQHWFIVSGDLEEEQAVEGTYRYSLSDPATPHAYLILNSTTPWPVGRTTVSGHIDGFIPPLPPGEDWYADMRADPELAFERPPPWSAILLALSGLVIIAAMRSPYPMFVTRQARRAARATGLRHVVVRPDAERPGDGVTRGVLDLDVPPGTAPNLTIDDGRSVPVRVHSRLTSLRVGDLRTLTTREPVIRVLSASGDMYLGFQSPGERDAVAATLLYGT